MIQKYLYGLPSEQYVPPNVVGFSARTSANMTQVRRYSNTAIQQRQSGGGRGAVPGAKCVAPQCSRFPGGWAVVGWQAAGEHKSEAAALKGNGCEPI